jgi:hypothetical protein
MPFMVIADVGMHPEAGMTRPGKPRKRVDAADSAAIEARDQSTEADGDSEGLGEQSSLEVV